MTKSNKAISRIEGIERAVEKYRHCVELNKDDISYLYLAGVIALQKVPENKRLKELLSKQSNKSIGDLLRELAEKVESLEN